VAHLPIDHGRRTTGSPKICATQVPDTGQAANGLLDVTITEARSEREEMSWKNPRASRTPAPHRTPALAGGARGCGEDTPAQSAHLPWRAVPGGTGPGRCATQCRQIGGFRIAGQVAHFIDDDRGVRPSCRR
jgi:hypothetical protein